MPRFFWVLFSVSALLLAGAIFFIEQEAPALPSPLFSEEKKLYVGSAMLTVDIAETEEQKIRGLSFRSQLSEDRGMLFLYDAPTLPAFWMKDMEIALDIVWIDADSRVAEITRNVPPASFPQTFSPSVPVQSVLEVNAGWTERHGVRVGDRLFSPSHAKHIEESFDSDFEAIASKSEYTDRRSAPPFTPQAPFAEWNNPRYQDGCEEASLVMVDRWLRKKGLTREESREEILALSHYQEEHYGYFEDTSADDTAKLFREYYGHTNITVAQDIGANDIQQAIAAGSIVLVPTNGRVLRNPYYTPPGPERHMLVIYGYDASEDEFIVHDPGTKRGEGYRYASVVLESALRDYPSGRHLPLEEERKAMIVVASD